MTQASSRPSIASALASDEFRQALPRITAYAAGALRRLGWAEGRGYRPAAAEISEVVNDAVAACLGDRKWGEDLSLEAFVCSVIKSQLSHKRASWAQRCLTPLDDTVEPAAPSSRRDDRLAACHLLARIEQAIAGDPQVESLFAAIGDGKRADLAATLGWTPELVKAVTARMKRRLAAVGLDKDDDDDGRERDGGPRGAPPTRGVSRRRAA